MPSDALIQQFGPIIILIYGAYYVLPNLVTQVMGVISRHNQSRATVAEAPYEIVKTMLSNSTRNDLIAIELIGIRASQERLEAVVNNLAAMFSEFTQSNKEQKS